MLWIDNVRSRAYHTPKTTARITAKTVVPPYGRFQKWLLMTPTGTLLKPNNDKVVRFTATDSPVVTVPQGSYCFAIASYAPTQLNPDPCDSIVEKIKKLGPVPRRTLGEPVPQPWRSLYEELQTCQLNAGEPVTVWTVT